MCLSKEVGKQSSELRTNRIVRLCSTNTSQNNTSQNMTKGGEVVMTQGSGEVVMTKGGG